MTRLTVIQKRTQRAAGESKAAKRRDAEGVQFQAKTFDSPKMDGAAARLRSRSLNKLLLAKTAARLELIRRNGAS